MNPDRVNWHENLEFGPINPVRVKLRVEISNELNPLEANSRQHEAILGQPEANLRQLEVNLSQLEANLGPI